METRGQAWLQPRLEHLGKSLAFTKQKSYFLLLGLLQLSSEYNTKGSGWSPADLHPLSQWCFIPVYEFVACPLLC